MTVRYKILVSYDGTNYYGWQEQPNVSTISGTIRNTMRRIMGHQDVYIVGASRTDAGVHAVGQVALLTMNKEVLSTEKLLSLCNMHLPRSIAISSLEKAHPLFHPFYNISYKTYHYYLYRERPQPFQHLYGYYYRYPFDEKKLEEVLQTVIGTHDFRSFSTGEPIGSNGLCTIYSIDFTVVNKQEGTYCIVIKGNRFLRHMIRRLVGAALTIATHHRSYTNEYFTTTLHSTNANHPLSTAPACGLVLHEIVYHTVF